ncbi:hypothetical protein ACP70R_015072 [Stipagrostis hirtigluma subsp. patula]
MTPLQSSSLDASTPASTNNGACRRPRLRTPVLPGCPASASITRPPPPIRWTPPRFVGRRLQFAVLRLDSSPAPSGLRPAASPAALAGAVAPSATAPRPDRRRSRAGAGHQAQEAPKQKEQSCRWTSSATACGCTCTTVIGGRERTAIQLIWNAGPPHASMPGRHFGDTVAVDDLVTDGPDVDDSRAVGRAQGT